MNEFREDLASGDWVIIASGRAVRPDELGRVKARRPSAPKTTCPFEDLKKSGNWPPVFAYPNVEHWRLVIVPNKYPALEHPDACSVQFKEGIYSARTGIGMHELVVTRDHAKNFGEISLADAVRVFMAFQDRAKAYAEDRCVNYVVPFFNWGIAAGASLTHPHYQILGLPVVPAHAAHSIAHSERYFDKHHHCVRCDIIAVERKEKIRVVGENRHAIAIAPYAGKFPFEIRILPKKHESHFYKTPGPVIRDVAALVQIVMKAFKRSMSDPDLNFFVHEAPLDGKPYPHHHWHVEIFPRVSIPAGFEFSTGMYINVVPPETAAQILKKGKKASPRY